MLSEPLAVPRIDAVLALAPASAMPSVRLWRVALDDVDDADATLAAWLSPTEQARAKHFVFATDARRFRTAHAALRRLLHAHCGWPPRGEFGSGEHGKPCLGPGRPGFNLSHSGAWALVAIGSGPEDVGVDVEHLHPIDDLGLLADRVFTPDERHELRSVAAEHAVRGFLTGWTRKEACLKALGSGLSVEPGTFTAGLVPMPREVMFATDQGSVLVRVQTVDAGPDLLAAVAITGGPGTPGRCSAP